MLSLEVVVGGWGARWTVQYLGETLPRGQSGLSPRGDTVPLGPGSLELRSGGGGWWVPPWLITTYFRQDVLNIRVASQKVPRDPLLQSFGFINEDTAERGRDLPEATQPAQG